jgi:Fe2+ transport system protein FeoA
MSLNFESAMRPCRPVPPTAPDASKHGRVVPLGRLRPGESGVVRRIMGRAEDVHRLEEFGLRDGTLVEMFRPGNPCILRCVGGKVCLRVAGSLEIFVAPLSAAS